MNRAMALDAAVRQLADWARAWVDNETCILETPSEKLTDAEKAALVLLAAIENAPPRGLS